MAGTDETLTAADLVEVMEAINDDIGLLRQHARCCLPFVEMISTGYSLELALSSIGLWNDQEDEREEVDVCHAPGVMEPLEDFARRRLVEIGKFLIKVGESK